MGPELVTTRRSILAGAGALAAYAALERDADAKNWPTWAGARRSRRPDEVPGCLGFWDAQRSTIGTTGGLVDSVTDVKGVTGTVTSTGAARPALSATGWNGLPCFDFGVGGTCVLVTPSVSLSAHAFFAVAQCGASSGYLVTHVNDSTVGYLYCTSPGSSVRRSGVISTKNGPVGWMTDGVKHSAGRAYDTTHASHVLYQDGLPVTTSDVQNGSPNAIASGALYIGNAQVFTDGIRGLYASFAVFNRVPTALEWYGMHLWARRAWAF